MNAQALIEPRSQWRQNNLDYCDKVSGTPLLESDVGSQGGSYLSIRILRCLPKWSSYRFKVSSNLTRRVGSYDLDESSPVPCFELFPDKSGSAAARLRVREEAVHEVNIVQQVMSLE